AAIVGRRPRLVNPKTIPLGHQPERPKAGGQRTNRLDLQTSASEWLQPEPVRRLDEEHVLDGGAEHLPQLLPDPEPVVVREVGPLLLPHEKERRAGAPLPAEDGVAAEGAEVEVAVLEFEGRASVAGVDAEACHSPVLVQLGHGAAGGAVDVEVERAGLAELLEAAVPPGRYEGAGEELERELGRERVVDAKAEVERPLADVGEDVAGAEGAHGEGVVDAVEVLVVVELPPERGLERDREGVAGTDGDPEAEVAVVLGRGA